MTDRSSDIGHEKPQGRETARPEKPVRPRPDHAVSGQDRSGMDRTGQAKSGEAKLRQPASAVEEIGGRDGPDPTRYGDYEKDGRCVDF